MAPRATTNIDKPVPKWTRMQFDYLMLPSGIKLIGRPDRTRFTPIYYRTREEALAGGILVLNSEWGQD